MMKKGGVSDSGQMPVLLVSLYREVFVQRLLYNHKSTIWEDLQLSDKLCHQSVFTAWQFGIVLQHKEQRLLADSTTLEGIA